MTFLTGMCVYKYIHIQDFNFYTSLSQTEFILLYRFIRVGGYKLLNSWLTYSKTTTNTPMLQLILLTLQKLPLTVDHLKQVAVYFKLLLLLFIWTLFFLLEYFLILTLFSPPHTRTTQQSWLSIWARVERRKVRVHLCFTLKVHIKVQ